MNFLTVLSSAYIRTVIEGERWFDHIKRFLTGLPSATRAQITPDVYIGGQYRLNARTLFQKWGITGIVNMRTTAIYSDTDMAPIRILHLPTADRLAPSLTNIKAGIRFIQREIDLGGKVYIHCHYGEGRGPSMGIAYLISRGLNLDDALALVRKHRSFIRITKNQLARLQELTQEVLK